MRARLKPLAEQVIVITGATSGIGLATARMAAKAGAAVVLVARNEEALRRTTEEIVTAGGRAHPVVADVGDAEAVARAARTAVARFGGFDTWVNNAGIGVYGEQIDAPLGEHERLFRTNYFGVVHGSLEAVRHFRDRGGAGGAVVNVGSVLCDMGSPLLASYAASKHAVKGFTDSLRIEMHRSRIPISISLIKPSSVATPFPDHAVNHMDKAPRVPPPLYAPELVAETILYAATHPVRQLTVGFGGRAPVLAAALAPKLADRVFAATIPPLCKRRPDRPLTRGGRRISIYTEAQKHPQALAGIGLLALAGTLALFGRNRTL